MAGDYWSGIWEYQTGIGGQNYTKIAIVSQPNNSYNVYITEVENADNNFTLPKYFKWGLARPDVIPVLTRDPVTSNVTEHSISFPFPVGSGTVVTFHKKLSNTNLTDNYAITISDRSSANFDLSGNSGLLFNTMYRIMNPSDFGVNQGLGWFEEYRTLYNSDIVNQKSGFTNFKDIAGSWEQFKIDNIRGEYVASYRTSPLDGTRTRQMRKHMSLFELLNLHEKLKTETIGLTADVLAFNYANVAKSNSVVRIDYDWNEVNKFPYFTPFSEVTFSSNLATGIPTDFKFLTSHGFNSQYYNNWQGVQCAPVNDYVGVRMPLLVDGPKTLEFKLSGNTLSNVTIPGGCYYPHDLAAAITSELTEDGSDLRVDFHVDARNGTPYNYMSVGNPGSYAPVNNFYYVSLFSFSNVASSNLQVLCSDNDFLSNVLGLAAASTPCTVSGFSDTLQFVNISYRENGNYPKYSFRGTTPTKYYTDFGTLQDPGTVSTYFGNINTTQNPRDYYSAAYYTDLIADPEYHTSFCISVLLDYDQEYYVPKTWDEVVYKFDDLLSKFVILHVWVPSFATNEDALAGGICALNSSRNCRPIVTQGLGTYGLTVDKYIDGSNLTAYLTSSNAYTFTNYLVTPTPIIRIDGVWQTSNLQSVTGANRLVDGGFMMGQIKPSIVTALAPSAVNNVAYISFASFVFQDTEQTLTSTVKPLIVNFLQSIQAKYVIIDMRINQGGAVYLNFCHLVGKTNYETFYNSLVSRSLNSSKTLVQTSMYQQMADVYRNPSLYPASFLSGMTATYVNNCAYDFSTFTSSDNPDDIRLRIGSMLTYNGDNSGVGPVHVVYGLSSRSLSSTHVILSNFKKGDSNVHDIGSNTYMTTYGSYSKLGICSQTLVARIPTNFPKYVDALDHNTIRVVRTTTKVNTLLLQNEKHIAEEFSPVTYIDGISNYNVDTWLTEIGMKPGYGANINNINTWRDLRLERMIQQAISPESDQTAGYIEGNTVRGALPSTIF
jgi:hypothetical protein